MLHKWNIRSTGYEIQKEISCFTRNRRTPTGLDLQNTLKSSLNTFGKFIYVTREFRKMRIAGEKTLQ